MIPNRADFRPLDNSSTTRMAYDLEANHWLRALNSAQGTTTSIGSSFGFIGALISLLVIVIIWALTLVVYIVSGIWNFITNTDKPKSGSMGLYTGDKPHRAIFADEPKEKYFHSWK